MGDARGICCPATEILHPDAVGNKRSFSNPDSGNAIHRNTKYKLSDLRLWIGMIVQSIVLYHTEGIIISCGYESGQSITILPNPDPTCLTIFLNFAIIN